MEPHQQPNGEAEEKPEVEQGRADATGSGGDFGEDGCGAEPSTSECGGEGELKGEHWGFSPRGVKSEGRNGELKRENSSASSPRDEGRKEELKRENSTSSPRGEKNEGRREHANPLEGLRAGGGKGKGSGGKGNGRGGKGAGKESGKNGRGETNRGSGGDGANKSSETIRAAGLPSMRRTKSQPSRSRGGGEREEIPEEMKEHVQEKEEIPSASSERPSGEVGVNWASWVAWVKEWVKKQEPAIVAVRNILLQLRTRVESRVKQHWPLVRAWLILITRVMLMLSLLGLEAAIRGIASLFRLGSAAHFLLLWCTVLSFIRLSGIFNLVIVLVMPPFS